jgi:hypothetical protein
MWARIFANKFVVFVLIVIVVVALCWLVGLRFHFEAGAGGIDLGILHNK